TSVTMRTPQKLLLGAVSVAGALAVSFSLASRRQQRTLTATIERLRIQGRPASGRRHAISSRGGDPDTLPAPVARYLRWALGDDSDLQEVRLTQTGRLRTDVHSDRWMAFEAEHLV